MNLSSVCDKGNLSLWVLKLLCSTKIKITTKLIYFDCFFLSWVFYSSFSGNLDFQIRFLIKSTLILIFKIFTIKCICHLNIFPVIISFAVQIKVVMVYCYISEVYIRRISLLQCKNCKSLYCNIKVQIPLKKTSDLNV